MRVTSRLLSDLPGKKCRLKKSGFEDRKIYSEMFLTRRYSLCNIPNSDVTSCPAATEERSDLYRPFLVPFYTPRPDPAILSFAQRGTDLSPTLRKKVDEKSQNRPESLYKVDRTVTACQLYSPSVKIRDVTESEFLNSSVSLHQALRPVPAQRWVNSIDNSEVVTVGDRT